MKFHTLVIVILLIRTTLSAAEPPTKYTYTIDLVNIIEDRVKVILSPPRITESEIVFYLPKIIPGTYKIADYGRFVHDFMAVDKKGNAIKVEKLDLNSWKIYDARKIKSISYWIEDSFDTKIDGQYIFEPAGTNIEVSKNFVINTAGFLGYFEGMKKIEYKLNVVREEIHYGATGLIATETGKSLTENINLENKSISQNAKLDIYKTDSYDNIVDSPIMYFEADTAVIKVANTEVLIASYSPNKRITAKQISENIEEILFAQRNYLGGELPVNKYAFIFYFVENPPKYTGALEHSYSSMYFLEEQPIENIKQMLRNVASHEFFHIITPLNIHSEEIQDFDFNDPKMSQHLWLYEGVTEYFASNMQVKGGLITRDQYLNILRNKIINTTSLYKNELPFTEFSKKVLVNEAEFGNVYQKGALIGMCLDIKLRYLSDGQYGMQDLVKDLSKQFGKNKPFKDNELFDHISNLTFPEISEFLDKHVAANNPLPYQDIFDLVGVNYTENAMVQSFSIGITDKSVSYNTDREKFYISNSDELDAFGTALGLRGGDLILEMNRMPVPPRSEIGPFIQEIRANMKEGDPYSIKVGRVNESGEEVEIVLKANIFKIERQIYHLLEFNTSATELQLKTRESWLR